MNLYTINKSWLSNVWAAINRTNSVESRDIQYKYHSDRWIKLKKEKYEFMYLRENIIRPFLLKYFHRKYNISFKESIVLKALPILKFTSETRRGYQPITFDLKKYVNYYIIVGLNHSDQYEGGELIFNKNISVSDNTLNYRVHNAKNIEIIKLSLGDVLFVNNKNTIFKVNKIKKGTNSIMILPFKQIIK